MARDARAPAPVGTVLAIEGYRAQIQWDDGETTSSRVDLLVPSDTVRPCIH